MDPYLDGESGTDEEEGEEEADPMKLASEQVEDPSHFRNDDGTYFCVFCPGESDTISSSGRCAVESPCQNGCPSEPERAACSLNKCIVKLAAADMVLR